MDVSKLSDHERLFRSNVRNYLMVATLPELRRELELSNERKDTLRARFVQELIDEYEEPTRPYL